jgi:hypothetical protein
MAATCTAFQRRHYQAVAEILSNAGRDANRTGDLFAVSIVENIIERFEDMFKADNPRFSVSRFSDAARK